MFHLRFSRATFQPCEWTWFSSVFLRDIRGCPTSHQSYIREIHIADQGAIVKSTLLITAPLLKSNIAELDFHIPEIDVADQERYCRNPVLLKSVTAGCCLWGLN